MAQLNYEAVGELGVMEKMMTTALSWLTDRKLLPTFAGGKTSGASSGSGADDKALRYTVRRGNDSTKSSEYLYFHFIFTPATKPNMFYYASRTM